MALCAHKEVYNEQAVDLQALKVFASSVWGCNHCSVALKKRQKIMKIQNKNRFNIVNILYQAFVLPKTLLTECYGELRVAKDLVCPRESWPSELLSFSFPQKNLTTTGRITLPREMSGVNLSGLSQS